MPDGIVKPVEELAELVEDTIFKKFRNTDPKYKAHIRSRVFNLKVRNENCKGLQGVWEAEMFGLILGYHRSVGK